MLPYGVMTDCWIIDSMGLGKRGSNNNDNSTTRKSVNTFPQFKGLTHIWHDGYTPRSITKFRSAADFVTTSFNCIRYTQHFDCSSENLYEFVPPNELKGYGIGSGEDVKVTAVMWHAFPNAAGGIFLKASTTSTNDSPKRLHLKNTQEHRMVGLWKDETVQNKK